MSPTSALLGKRLADNHFRTLVETTVWLLEEEAADLELKRASAESSEARAAFERAADYLRGQIADLNEIHPDDS